MKNMNLKVKLMISALVIVVFIMILSTVIVSFFIYRQNRQNAYSFLSQSMSIVKDDLLTNVDVLSTYAHQMATAEIMESNLQLLGMIDPNQELNMVGKEAYRNIAISLYTIANVAKISQVSMYNKSGDLLVFAVSKDNGYILGYPLKNRFETAYLSGKSALEDESWKTTESIAGISLKFETEIPKQEGSKFEIIEGFLSIISHHPVNISKFNSTTGQYEPDQFGFLSLVNSFKEPFIDRLAKLTGTQLNVFSEKGLSVGQLPGYKEFDFGMYKNIESTWSLVDQTITLNDVKLENRDYFQGLLPVYSASKSIGVVAVLQSTDIAMSNTWQIITILCLVSIGCILVIIPFSYFFSGFLAKPLVDLSRVLTNVEETGDFSQQAEVKNFDETGVSQLHLTG
ncbi:MAG: hypothetical protein HQ517_12770 [SAR324 cluster bacterium]|nr:hypothetical protein [SAR324 cluster bacterium]